MIDHPNDNGPDHVEFAEITDSGDPSKYLPNAIALLLQTKAEAVAIVVVNGTEGNGGTSAAITTVGLKKLPAMLREIADFQEQQTAKMMQAVQQAAQAAKARDS